ncbi:MAG: hypothetical protein COA56_13355 [Dehalococcoidia bacterium]|jgi:hypothetical protein|nr:hypothetical protein [Dehalococcoidia bacterium]PCJ73955.1 MAG: hypothetical protein COA56_13355 [Dehalococcoidia bacterium]PKB85491.1 MAG: hypothetical protein BZY86_02120 [SAR202 cluster bacterium MP-NPac-SRR3961935-G1]RUA30346.1 MAG: hypothetical protein DSY78_09460 [Chloroflexota bacterium]|tara:strand:- start:1279 stop:1686 length:408 start_codon:yes stop_codon:yes gene_type:complete
MLYLFKGCGKCEGDLLMASDEWRCFQCGRVYYPTRTPEEQQLGRVAVQESMPVGADSDRPKVRRSARHLNPVVAASRFNEEQWWHKNRQVISHLDQGKKMREIAEIVGKGPRQIRVVRERLRDLRSAVPELVTAG